MKTFDGKHGPLLIAEIGGNHEGDFGYAKLLTKEAINTGVDYIKFQLYRGDTLVSKIENPQGNKHFKKFELKKEQYIQLAKLVKSENIGYMASVWDINYLEWIDPYISIYKIGSGDLTAYPIIKSIIRKKKPLILSTGLSSEEEILNTINYIYSIDKMYRNPDYLAILQCTSMYPISYSDVHLNVISRLKKITNLHVGYSDHTEGYKALIYAYVLGADILEFHFTDSREGKTFRDHKVSLVPSEVKLLINEIKIINSLKGDEIKKPLQIEIENKHHISFRRGVYTARNICEGSTISDADLICLRPNHGIDAREYDKLVGRKIKINLKAYEKLKWSYIE